MLINPSLNELYHRLSLNSSFKLGSKKNYFSKLQSQKTQKAKKTTQLHLNSSGAKKLSELSVLIVGKGGLCVSFREFLEVIGVKKEKISELDNLGKASQEALEQVDLIILGNESSKGINDSQETSLVQGKTLWIGSELVTYLPSSLRDSVLDFSQFAATLIACKKSGCFHTNETIKERFMKLTGVIEG